MFTHRLCRICAFFLLAVGPLHALAADCEYETWNVLQANKNNATALDTIMAPSWVREPEFRGTFSILQTCILTLAACIYTALHLNVPNETQSGWARMVAYKARWVFMALVCPEVILVLALDQLKAARKLREELLSLHSASGRGENEKERACIDLTYGFFVVMGGIRVRASDLRKHGYLSKSSIDKNWADHINTIIHDREFLGGPRQTFQLTPDGVIALAEAGHWDVLVSADTIQDRSKANAVQKSLVLLQVSWMAISCTARLVYRLPLTLLEIHTMVHVLCAFAMYALWFKKPLDIHGAEMIGVDEADSTMATMVQMAFYSKQLPRLGLYGKGPDGNVLWVSNDELVTPDPSPRVVSSGALVVLIDSKSEAGNPTVDDVEAARFELLTQFLISKALGERQPPTPAHDGDIDIPKEPASSHVLAFGELAIQLRLLQEGASKTSFCLTSNANVSNDYQDGLSGTSPFLIMGATLGWHNSEKIMLSVTMTVLLTMAYGGVHLAAWNSPCFPTDAERLLWRISCFFIAGVVPFSFVVFMGIEAWDERSLRRGGRDSHPLAFITPILVALLFYASSRMFVVVESFISLRQVPVGAYWVPPWLQAIPHV